MIYRIIYDRIENGRVVKDVLEEFEGDRAELDKRINLLARIGCHNFSVDTEEEAVNL